MMQFNLHRPHQQSHRHQLDALVQATASFIRDFKTAKKPRFLSLLGTSGSGKTFLAKYTWRWFDKSGRFYKEPNTGATLVHTGQFCDWRSFVEQCLSGDYSRTQDLRDDYFVVLDDIGAKRDKSGAWVDKLDTILADRSEAKWTLITANLSLQVISDLLDARIASRLIRAGSVVVDVTIPDYNAIQQ